MNRFLLICLILFTAGSLVAQNPTVANLTTTSGTNVKWYDAVSGGNLLPATTVLVSGNHYYASQTVNGVESSARLDVTATIHPSPQGSLTANGPFCATGSGMLTWTATTGTGPYTVIYYDGTANRTASNVSSETPFAVYTTPVTARTIYTLVSVQDANCTRSGGFTGDTSTITVNPNPTADAGSAISAICQSGTSAALGGSYGGGASSAVWSAPSGTFTNNTGSTPGTATFTAASNSTTPITLTLTTSGGSCGTTTATKQITVNPNPTADAGSAISAICQSGTSAALGGSYGGGASSAVWTAPSGTFTNNTGSTPGTATFTAASNSTTPITLTLTTSGGSCGTTTATKQITVNPNPTADAGSAISAICQSGTSAALGGSYGGGASSAVWTAPSGTFTNNTGSTPGTVTFTAASNSTTPITLTLTTSGGSCGTTTATKQITVNALPSAPTAGSHTAAQTQIIWNWNTVSGAAGYKLGTSNDYSSSTDIGNAATKTETGLTCNTAYTRYVWAYNATGCVSAVTTLTQTTSACGETPWAGSLSGYGTLGVTYNFLVTGTTSGGSIWGCDIYTDDSNLAKAAVHDGWVADGVTKHISVTILAGQTSYSTCTWNGITSSSYGEWPRSYQIISSW